MLLMPLLLALVGVSAGCYSGEATRVETETEIETETKAEPQRIETGADQMGKVVQACGRLNVGLVANHTAQVQGVHLLDTLLARDVRVVRIFGPEHGFRGDAADGEKVESGSDAATGLPVISLYGSNKKPTPEQLTDIDVLVFDIQDVGARFYTYISTLHLVMEAAAENDVKLLVLDRPNPNGHYMDGPVLKPAFKSFVGMHPVPIVHGMTVGEYAQMINGEGWLAGGAQCDLEVIPCAGYAHHDRYQVPIAPSPNLPNMTSIYLYPSLALFEGTEVSVGRGTEKPFQQIGMPGFEKGNHEFTPRSIPGVSVYPPHQGELCKGYDLSDADVQHLRTLDLQWLLTMYRHAPDQDKFFLKSGFFNKLAGTDELMKQVKAGFTEAEIRATWKKDLEEFENVRQQYLLYEDF